jgi:dihydrofolate synthase/folylpolyglutamate synthase
VTRIESYTDALRWLFARNQFSIKLGLEGPRRLLELLGNPEAGGVYLHVAGTNGKGSVCTNLVALLAAAGYKRIGLYTSPHLVSFRERIRVDGMPPSTQWVTEWMQRFLPLLEEYKEEINPTYFECVTAMAFAYFEAQKCEVVVLETGLGGRLDATNVVLPKVTAITSISYDHTAILGDTLEAIWGEKLGIVKPGVPLVVDEARPSLAALAQARAREMNAPFFNVADRLSLDAASGVEDTAGKLILQGQYGEYTLPADLRPEPHQVRNAALSLLTFEAFWGGELPPAEKWLSALQSARFAGRTQWLEGKAAERVLPVLLDGAHNPSGVEALCRYLSKQSGRPRIFFAVMRDKDYSALYRRLHAVSGDVVYLDLSISFPRALTFSELRATLTPEEQIGLQEAAISWEALAPLLLPGSGADFGVVCGSLYLLGEIIPTLLPHYRGLEGFERMLEEEK